MSIGSKTHSRIHADNHALSHCSVCTDRRLLSFAVMWLCRDPVFSMKEGQQFGIWLSVCCWACCSSEARNHQVKWVKSLISVLFHNLIFCYIISISVSSKSLGRLWYGAHTPLALCSLWISLLTFCMWWFWAHREVRHQRELKMGESSALDPDIIGLNWEVLSTTQLLPYLRCFIVHKSTNSGVEPYQLTTCVHVSIKCIQGLIKKQRQVPE